MNAGSPESIGRQRGFSLVELLISIVIGTIALLAMVQTLGLQDANRRAVVGGNDAAQTEAYSLYLFDDLIRSASANVQQGGGVVGLVPTAYGCPLSGALPSGQSFGALALPAPFDSLPVANTLRLAPVLVQQVAGSNSHRIALLRVSGSALGTTIRVNRESAPGMLDVPSTLGLQVGEWVLGVESTDAFGLPCTVARVGAREARTLANRDNTLTITLDGATFGWVVGNLQGTLSSLGNRPQFTLYSVDDTTRRLLGLDLFTAALTPQTIVENVIVLRALYGVDDGNGAGSVDPDGIVDRWVTPTGDFAYSALTDGSATAAERLRRIAAVRFGLVVRQPMRQGQDAAATPTATLFYGVPGITAETYTVSDTLYRARAIEFTLNLHSARLAGARTKLLNAMQI